MLACSQRALARPCLPARSSSLLRMAPNARGKAARRAGMAQAGKGFGNSSTNAGPAGGNSANGGNSGEMMADDLLAYRQVQMQASNVLTALLQAPDLAAAAKANINSFDQSFFAIADGYLNMAKKEGAADVVDTMERVIRAAMEAKQSTLRPEIQLLNRLVAATDSSERQQLLSQADTKAVLASDDGYFFALLERFTNDMESQPAANPHREALLAQLKDIKQLATAAAA